MNTLLFRRDICLLASLTNQVYFQRYFSELISKSWWNMMVYAEKIGKNEASQSTRKLLTSSINRDVYNWKLKVSRKLCILKSTTSIITIPQANLVSKVRLETFCYSKNSRDSLQGRKLLWKIFSFVNKFVGWDEMTWISTIF